MSRQTWIFLLSSVSHAGSEVRPTGAVQPQLPHTRPSGNPRAVDPGATRKRDPKPPLRAARVPQNGRRGPPETELQNFPNPRAQEKKKAEGEDPTLHARDGPIRRARPLPAAGGAGGPAPSAGPAPSGRVGSQDPTHRRERPRRAQPRPRRGSRPRRPRAREAGSHLRIGQRRGSAGPAGPLRPECRAGEGGVGTVGFTAGPAPGRTAARAAGQRPGTRAGTQTSSPRPAVENPSFSLHLGATQPLEVPASGPG